jgi:hypothetical protein
VADILNAVRECFTFPCEAVGAGELTPADYCREIPFAPANSREVASRKLVGGPATLA